jgi:DNA replication protein DnaC/transposase
VDLYRKVGLACSEGMSQREAARQFGISRDSVRKMMAFSVPPGYRRTAPVKRPKLDAFTGIIDGWLEGDREVHRKQRHTAQRVFERLRDEHGFTGGYTIIKDYMRERERRGREMFVALAHPPGHAQADFGEAVVVIGGVAQKAHFFVMDLPHSDACCVRAYPAATAEAWVDGHVHAFAFFGRVPVSVLYDNDRCLVAKILPDGTRQRATLFSGLLSHYLFRDRYGRPGKGNDKGNVEGLAGYSRRNFMVPIPRFATWEAFNAYLKDRCRRRQADVLRGESETIGARLARDLAAMSDLPAAPFDACDQATGRISSQALVRYKTNDYSVPVAYGHRDVWIRGYVDEVVIGCGGKVIARHPRCHDREDTVFDPVHYLPLIERPGSGSPLGRVGSATRVRDPAPPDGGADGQGRAPRIRPGPAPARDLRHRGPARGGEEGAAIGRGRLRCREAPRPLPCRKAATEAGPRRLSLPAACQCRDDFGGQRHVAAVGGCGMTAAPKILLADHLKTLKLPTFLREYEKVARQCAAEGQDHVQFLACLVELELIDRERRMVERRIKAAKFPTAKSLDSFDFKAIPKLNKMQVLELARCEWIGRRENVIALGPSGTGKTHVAIGLGLAACQKGMSVSFTTAAALVNELMEARDERRLLRIQKQMAGVKLLIIDELGFVPLSKTGAELLFELISQRYERGATMITSNLPFDEWTETFGTERLAGALLDRLTHHVNILEMNGESYRLRQSRARKTKAPT